MNSSLNNWARNLIAPTTSAQSKQIVHDKRALVETLEKSKMSIMYRNADGILGHMVITLNKDIVGDIAQNGPSTSIMVYAIDRVGVRNLRIDRIEEVVNVTTCNDDLTPSKKTTNASEPIRLTIAQQTAMYYWVSKTVHPKLAETKSPKDVSVSFITDIKTNAVIRAVEHNTGLMLDL